MLSLLVLLVALGVLLLVGGGLTLSSVLIAVAMIVIVWSIGAFVPRRQERRRSSEL